MSMNLAHSQNAWVQGGNTVGLGQNQRAGTNNNRPFRFETNNTQRVKINSSTGYNVNGYTIPRSGFMFLGVAGTASNHNIYNNTNFGAYSMLHLSGRLGTFTQQLGNRPWMQTGITFTDNQDLAYVGLK